MLHDNAIALPKTVLDLCDERTEALAAIKEAYETLSKAESLLQRIGLHGLPYEGKPRNDYDETRHRIDAGMWRVAFDKTGFMLLMDAEAKAKFFDQVEREAPEFIEGNIRSTFLSLAQDAEAMFARGLVNVFLRLSKRHHTNTSSPFKVNDRAILTYMVQSRWRGGLEVNHRGSDYINDIDRVFKVLAGETHVPRSLETAINGELMHSRPYEDAFYQIKGFKNGNMHIFFKRADLLERANRIIHDYYEGNALARGRSEAA